MTGLLHLVRHGQTTANVAKELDTRPPGAPLTPEGAEQARRFAADRPGIAPAALLSSVARRAQQTAGLIGGEWDAPVVVIDGVHEVQAGDLEGRNDDEAIKQFQDVVRRWHEGDLDAALPGGESARDLLARYVPAIDAARAQYLDDGDVYLVSHGAAIRLVASRLAGVDGDYAHRHVVPNTGVISLRPLDGAAGDGGAAGGGTAGGWELVSWADAPAPGAADPMG